MRPAGPAGIWEPAASVPPPRRKLHREPPAWSKKGAVTDGGGQRSCRPNGASGNRQRRGRTRRRPGRRRRRRPRDGAADRLQRYQAEFQSNTTETCPNDAVTPHPQAAEPHEPGPCPKVPGCAWRRAGDVIQHRRCGIGISVVPSLPKAVRGVRLPYPALINLYKIRTYDTSRCGHFLRTNLRTYSGRISVHFTASKPARSVTHCSTPDDATR